MHADRSLLRYYPLRHKRVHLPLFKVADTPFYIYRGRYDPQSPGIVHVEKPEKRKVTHLFTTVTYTTRPTSFFVQETNNRAVCNIL